MRKMGFYDHPVTIGGSTSYVDADSPFAKNNQLNNLQKYNQEVLNNAAQQTPWQQVTGAVQDMTRNYFDMKQDNTVGADDYFHCKTNYEAASRGSWGEATAQIIGDAKEGFDYLKNRFYKGFNYPNALADYWHDKDVNKQGRQQVHNPLYSNAKEACQYQRVKKINDKY